MKRYSDKLIETMIKKLLLPGGPNVKTLSDETGISQWTLRRWMKLSMNTPNNKRTENRPNDLSWEDKFNLIMEALKKNEGELGIFLREKGVHSQHLELWQKQIKDKLSKNERGKAVPLSKLKSLEKEIEKKDKALAEFATLAILKKKVFPFLTDAER